MTTYTAVKSFSSDGPMGPGMIAPIVMVASGSALYAVDTVVSFPFVKPSGLKIVAAFASINKAESFVTGNPVKIVKVDNTAKTISVTLGTAVIATTGNSISVMGVYGVDMPAADPSL